MRQLSSTHFGVVDEQCFKLYDFRTIMQPLVIQRHFSSDIKHFLDIVPLVENKSQACSEADLFSDDFLESIAEIEEE